MAVTILVVDDDLAIVQLLNDYLSGLGYTVASASDGYAALGAFAQSKPQLVLLDYNMPAGSGTDVLARIRGRADGANIPVIFLTAASSVEIELLVPTSPLVRHLRKPLDLRKLKALVEELLGPQALQTLPPAAAYPPGYPVPPALPPGYPPPPGYPYAYAPPPAPMPTFADEAQYSPDQTVIDLDAPEDPPQKK